MKILALLLIVANLAFFLLQFQDGTSSYEAPRVNEKNTGIFLLSELKDSERASSVGQKQAENFQPVLDDLIERSLLLSDFSHLPVSLHDVRFGLKLADRSYANLAIEPNGLGDSNPPRWTEPTPIKKTFEPVKRPEKVITPVTTQPQATVTETVIAAGKEAIEKAKETVSQTAVPEPTKPKEEASEPKKVPTMCYEAGPFDTMRQFYHWRKQTGIPLRYIKSISQAREKVADYLVYLPAEATYQQSLANVDMLKSKGITDYWLFSKGDTKGDISLGVFSTENRAENLKKQLAEKSIAASIRPRYKKVSRIYAQIYIDQRYEDNLISSRDLWIKTHPEFAIRVISGCVFN
ncbi:MAG: hypothetical protein Kow0065_16650 [Methylomicrobium sp.]